MTIAASDQIVAQHDAATRLQAERAAVAQARARLLQAHETLGAMPTQYQAIVSAATGEDLARWNKLGQEFAAIREVVAAAIAAAEVQALAELTPGG